MSINSGLVAVAGGANIDIHGRPAAPLIGQDSNPGSVRIATGGVARNVAENLARLGIDVQLISAVGTDEHGRLLRQQCRDAGIGMDYLHEFDGLPTSTYLSILDADGDMHVAISDMAIVEQLDPATLMSSQRLLSQAALVIVDTNLSDVALAWFMDMLIDQPLFVDTVSTSKAARIKPYLGAVHTLKTSRIEAEALSQVATDSETELRECASWFHTAGVERLFVTLGESGVFFSTKDAQGTRRLGAASGPIINAGGAGDAFLAGLAYAWLEELALEDSLRFALAAADVTLGCPGANNPALSRSAITERLEKDRG